MDFSTNCRICLEKSESMKLLSERNFLHVTYSDMIFYCTGINILNENKSYSAIHYICIICEEALLKSYDFKKRVIEANNRLYNILNYDIEVKPFQECSLLVDDKKNSLTVTELFETDATSDKKFLKRNKKNACMRCNIYFSCLEEFEMHKKTKHPRVRKKYDKAKLCLICGKLATNIKVHAETHKDPAERETFKCTICNRMFKMKDYLNKHMRTHSQPNDLRYECQYCGKKFRIWATRKHHIFREHGGEGRFFCNICDKAFFKTHHFKEHMLSHSGEKPYKCDLCEKGFRNISSLKSHTVTHTKVRNHKCEVCGKCFGLRRTLMDHMKIHTGEKNYICPVCSEAFIQNHVMRTHVSKKHPEYVLPPSGTVLSQKAIKKQELSKTLSNNS